MLVVDASVLVHAVTDDGPIGVKARRVALDPGSIVPDVADVEVASILRRWNLAGTLPDHRMFRAAEDLRALEIERLPTRPLLAHIVRLRHNLTAYDAAYVSIARLFDATLLTRDVKLSRVPNLPCRVEVI